MPSGDGSLQVTARPVRVLPDQVQGRIGRLTLLAAFELRSPHPSFGGLSSLELEADGRGLVLLSDRGSWLRTELRLAADGTLRGFGRWEIHPIRDAAGKAVRQPRHDAEAVARAPDGSWLIGFEGKHRIWRYPKGLAAGHPQRLRLPAALQDAPGNGSLEAVTVLPDGRLFILCERFLYPDGTHRGWIGRDGAMKPLAYVATDDFVPTDLAVDPLSGDVLVLERAFGLLRGTRARIGRLHAASLVPSARLQAEELARLEPPLPVDNFEGLAVQRNVESGAGLLYLISDDNFSRLQRTLLFQLRLD